MDVSFGASTCFLFSDTMKKIVFAILAVVLKALLPSCAVLKPISYERLQGTDVNFPEQVRTVGVVNCLPDLPNRVWVDDVQNSYEGEGQLTAESLAQGMAETRYFDQVVICDSAYVPSDVNVGLSYGQMDSLIRSLDVDMLFTVERVLLEMSTDKVWFPELMQRIPVLRVGVTPLVGAYKKDRERPLFKVCKTDTIYWELPLESDLNEVVRSASEYAGTIPLKYMLPYWEEVHRCYFDGGSAEMRDAGIYVREQDWDAAAELWRTVCSKKKGRYKLHAAYNLTLYHEMRDEFEQAKECLEMAYGLSKEGSFEYSLIKAYALQLEEQMLKNQRLQIQMKRFE